MQDQAMLIDLIAKCALRNQSALQELYRKVGPYLNKVAYNIVRSDAVSNEVLQDSFVEIEVRPVKVLDLAISLVTV